MIDKAVQDALAADATLVAMLGTFGGQPAIFVHGEVPAQFERGVLPYVALSDALDGPYLDGDRQTFGADVEILVLGADAGDAGPVEAAAKRVKAVLDEANIAPSGFIAGGTSVTGPTRQDPDDLTFGRRLVATLLLTET